MNYNYSLFNSIVNSFPEYQEVIIARPIFTVNEKLFCILLKRKHNLSPLKAFRIIMIIYYGAIVKAIQTLIYLVQENSPLPTKRAANLNTPPLNHPPSAGRMRRTTHRPAQP